MNSPILFLTYKKYESTLAVFNKIRDARPTRLYIASNAPKNSDEIAKCEQTRSIFDKIDWECEVKKLFRDKHLSLNESVSSAINWFFENEECGIILEDDCLPSLSFFSFCDEMLDRYKNDTRVMHIAGANTLPETKLTEDSYFFSRWPGIWGWATWRRTWEKIDFQMKNFEEFKKEKKILDIFKNKAQQEWMMERFEFAYSKYGNIWDYVYHYGVISSGGLCVTPAKNLIKNIGFTDDATHTSFEPEYYQKIVLEELNAPLQHPADVVANEKYLDILFEKVYKNVVSRHGIRRLTKHIPLNFKLVMAKNIRKLLG